MAHPGVIETRELQARRNTVVCENFTVNWVDFGCISLSVKRENFIKYGLLAKYGFDDGNDVKTNDVLTAENSND